jgi:hypothetical protein
MNVVSLLGNIAKVVTTVKSMAKVDEDGTLGIVTSAAEAATAVDVVKLQKQQTEDLIESTDRLLQRREAIVDDNYISEDKRDKKLKRIDEMLDENRKTNPMEVDDATKAALTEANKEKVEPPILAGLAPFTAMIGIPIFLMGLMKYLGPAGSALNADAALTALSSDAPDPKYAEWGTPPDEKSPIKKKTGRGGKKEKWWWTVPPQLPKDHPKGGPTGKEGDWTRQEHGGLVNERVHKRLMKRRYGQ